MILLASTVWAAPFPVPTRPSAVESTRAIETPMGVQTVGRAYYACACDSPFVGKVVSSTSFPAEGKVFSTITFDVEVDLKGTLGRRVSVMVPGGVAPSGQTVRTGYRVPVPVVGQRYALSMSTYKFDHPSPLVDVGDWMVFDSLRLSSDASLPAESVIISEFATFCGSL